MSELRLGFIGLGAMGQAMVNRILAAGFALQVYDRDQTVLLQAQAKGASSAQNIGELGADKDLVLVSVSNADLTEAVICAPDGLLASMRTGGIIVDLGTTPSAQCRKLAARAKQHGKYFLDAPVSGSTPWAELGELSMMVGGNENAFARARPVLASFSNKLHYLGKSGNGQLLKLCHQLTFVATLTGLAEAIAFAERNDLEAETVLRVLSDCVAPRHVIDFMLPLAKHESFDQGQGTLKLGHKDIQAVLQSAEEAGIKLPLAEVLNSYLDQAMSSGREEPDLFALVDMAREESYTNTKLEENS